MEDTCSFNFRDQAPRSKTHSKHNCLFNWKITSHTGSFNGRKLVNTSLNLNDWDSCWNLRSEHSEWFIQIERIESALVDGVKAQLLIHFGWLGFTLANVQDEGQQRIPNSTSKSKCMCGGGVTWPSIIEGSSSVNSKDWVSHWTGQKAIMVQNLFKVQSKWSNTPYGYVKSSPVMKRQGRIAETDMRPGEM